MENLKDLLLSMLEFDPIIRSSSSKLLQHPFLKQLGGSGKSHDDLTDSYKDIENNWWKCVGCSTKSEANEDGINKDNWWEFIGSFI